MWANEEYVREVTGLVVFVIVGVLLLGCGPSIRDKETYSAEIDFMEAAATEQVERGIAVIEENCVCEENLGVRGFASEACQDLAETILVVQYRMRYHLLFMEYLGGLSSTRPSRDPPNVPDPSLLCPDNDVVDAGVDDGGF